ncbi:ROK family transcriptional regulator [Streptomyces sp. NPDC090052]|uniref:ROK family transcriptional regulator n=1 Tax=unclassified Streptomyces TaxID=2593676 RepID=UPI002E231DFD|nr:ROK family transcriptional regulator [Streptomyces sp. NBC_00963]WSX65872.1 ROK family transcriptional regulator [Streptomyces sp. NBC_00932]
MAEQGRRTVRDLRRGNRAEVVQRLYFDGPLSRQELGAATGLSSGSISNVVAELAADGLLEEAGVVESEGGRPRTLLRVAPASGHLIGIDVGETRVRVELFDLSLGELARAERPLVHHGYDIGRIVGHIREAVADVLREADVSAARLVGVGVGVPGIIDRDGPDGVVVHGQTVGWDAVPLEAMLRESAELPSWVPLFIDNGAKTLGQAEMWFGGGRGASDAVVVLFGSGVSACVVVDGELYGGADSRAVEWGHTTVRVGGRRCRCGSPGCLEAYVGAEAIRERWLESGGPPAAAADEETALATLLAAALPTAGGSAGDTAAAGLLDETAEYLGAGIADLINLFRPERILVGGWAGLLLGPALLPAVRRYAKEYAMHHPAGRVTIDLGTLGADAVTLGAATLPLADFLARGGRHRRHDAPDAGAGPAALLRGQGNWRPVVVERR